MQLQPPIINIFEKAARKAGKNLLRDFGEIENLQIHSKNIGDFVTNADIKTQQILLDTLKYYYPDATYITEEESTIRGNEEIIVIDPIDGTTNFIHGIPLIGIVIGRIFEGEITDGIIFNPILNEFYWASKGKGSWCNNKRLRVSKRNDLINSLIGTGIPHANQIYSKYLEETAEVQSNHKLIQALAKELSADEKSRWQLVKDINLWVHLNLKKEMVDTVTALDALIERRGECQSHTFLFAALARASGIPTRIVNGLVYSTDYEGFLYHAWPEVFLGEWKAMDPTFGQDRADATHIKLTENSNESPFHLMEFVGKIAISWSKP